jgi:hypothetical protein
MVSRSSFAQNIQDTSARISIVNSFTTHIALGVILQLSPRFLPLYFSLSFVLTMNGVVPV